MSSGASTQREEGKGTKRGPDTQSEAQQQQQKDGSTGGNGRTDPPPPKTAKPNPASNEDNPPATPSTAPATALAASPAAGVAVAVKAESEGSAGTTDSEKVEEETLRSLGLSVGTRLEVMWLLEDDDKSVEKWWGCSVAGAKTGERDEAENRPIFTLHYDAYDTFEEADHDVCFVDRYRLVHLEDGAEMTWKREGQEVDRDAVLASLADEDVDLQEVISAQEEEEADDGGESIETQGMNALAQLPHHQQIAMAAGYRRMADVVKGHLRAKMQSNGATVISPADIENMFREVRGGGGGGLDGVV